MWENRISAHFEATFEPGPIQAPTQRPAGSAPASPLPHQIERMDIYQAARARAEFEHQLGKLFNPGDERQ